MQAEFVFQTLESVNGNKTRAAQILGIGRRSIYGLIERHNISVPNGDSNGRGHRHGRNASCDSAIGCTSCGPKGFPLRSALSTSAGRSRGYHHLSTAPIGQRSPRWALIIHPHNGGAVLTFS
ncbi:MAG: helix-turn-helix domain-containing protein [Candidatus Binataceae bacterium]